MPEGSLVALVVVTVYLEDYMEWACQLLMLYQRYLMPISLLTFDFCIDLMGFCFTLKRCRLFSVSHLTDYGTHSLL